MVRADNVEDLEEYLGNRSWIGVDVIELGDLLISSDGDKVVLGWRE